MPAGWRIETWKDGNDYMVNRNAKGWFVRWYKFVPSHAEYTIELPDTMYRHVYAIFYVESHNYKSQALYYYSTEKDLDPSKEAELKEKLYLSVERDTGYPQSEWWFDAQIDEEHSKVPYNGALIGKDEIFPSSGDPVRTSISYEAKLRKAAESIRNGAWHSKATLDKWLPILKEAGIDYELPEED